MKELMLKITLPLTIISFTIFTKWWYVLPVDAPHTLMVGFPLVCISDGWHTSGSLQIFVTELIVDFLIYFGCWFVVSWGIHRLVANFKTHKIIIRLLWGIASLILLGTVIIGSMPVHIYKVKRDFNMEVLTTGYSFIWEDRPQQPLQDD